RLRKRRSPHRGRRCRKVASGAWGNSPAGTVCDSSSCAGRGSIGWMGSWWRCGCRGVARIGRRVRCCGRLCGRQRSLRLSGSHRFARRKRSRTWSWRRGIGC
ncbi:hypothetical protein KEM55_000672, partial [Ascosphaera atra]